MPTPTLEIAEQPLRRSAATSEKTLVAESKTPTTTKPVWKGHAYPLGATWTGDGVNFALFSEHASGVELCLFNRLGEVETSRVRVTERANHVWHCFVPDLKPGQLY